VTLFGW